MADPTDALPDQPAPEGPASDGADLGRRRFFRQFAGDLFHGAFLWAYLSGRDPHGAGDFAQAAVALRITGLGNRAGLPTRAGVDAFLSSAPARA